MQLLSVIEKLELIGRMASNGNMNVYIDNVKDIERIELSHANDGSYYVSIITSKT